MLRYTTVRAPDVYNLKGTVQVFRQVASFRAIPQALLLLAYLPQGTRYTVRNTERCSYAYALDYVVQYIIDALQ